MVPLCSEKEVLHDMTYWGGIKIRLDKKYTHTLRDAFHVWSVWNIDATAQFDRLCQYVKKDSEHLSTELFNFHPFSAEAVKVDLSTFEFDTGKSDVLADCKQQLFNSTPELKNIFGLPKNLDDFRYACILYFLFQALRDRMCRQAFVLCTKLLQ